MYVAWHDHTDYNGSGTDEDIFYKMRNGTTGTWSTTEVVSTESTSNSERPSLKVGIESEVYVVWEDITDYGGSGTDWDIFHKMRNATTGTWSTTQVVSTESTGNSHLSSLALDGMGNVHVAWSDYTDYGGSGTDLDIFYKQGILDLLPTADFTADKSRIIEGEAIHFYYTGTDGNGIVSYQWGFGDGTVNSTAENPTHQYLSPGTFTVSITVVDTNGNASTVSKTGYITVEGEKGTNIILGIQQREWEMTGLFTGIFALVAGFIIDRKNAKREKRDKEAGTKTAWSGKKKTLMLLLYALIVIACCYCMFFIFDFPDDFFTYLNVIGYITP